MEKLLMKGNEALAEAAILSGCRFFFGYPITPQNEIPEYMSRRLPEVGGTFLQAESEVSAINMVYGAAGAGARVMTSSSSPGISLKQEGISYIAGAELPCVVVNVMRAGPGLGGIQPAQGDYFQATKGGGHGDYRLLVLAPGSTQELADLTVLAFDLADEYRNPVMVLTDAISGQMMEAVVLPEPSDTVEMPKAWATTGKEGRPQNVVTSFYLDTDEFVRHNELIQRKYRRMQEREVRFDTWKLDDAEVAVVAYGIGARLARRACEQLREEGVRVGLFRLITLYPFPSKAISDLIQQGIALIAVELSAGQMVEDVRLAATDHRDIGFYGCTGGKVPTVREVRGAIEEFARGESGA